MVGRFLALWLVVVSAIGYFWPTLVGTEVFDPFVRSLPALFYLIAGIMFIVGCLLPEDEIRQVGRRWPLVLVGTALQYTSMPFFAYLFGHVFRLGPNEFIGILMVGCVPGAMASNVLTLLARGNVSYSVTLTTSATLLSPFVVPLALWLLLGKSNEIDPQRVALDLMKQVVGPVLLGFFLARRVWWLRELMQKWGGTFANLAILWVIAVVVGVNRDRMLHGELSLLAALLAVNLCGYLAGYWGGRVAGLSEGERRALTLEIGMQNAGLGTVLVLNLFPDRPQAAVAPAIYTFGCMWTGTLLARYWSTRTVAPPLDN